MIDLRRPIVGLKTNQKVCEHDTACELSGRPGWSGVGMIRSMSHSTVGRKNRETVCVLPTLAIKATTNTVALTVGARRRVVAEGRTFMTTFSIANVRTGSVETLVLRTLINRDYHSMF